MGAESGTTATCTIADTTGADLIVLFWSQYSGVAAFTPSDSNNNSWTALTTGNCSPQGGQQQFTLYYASSAIVGANHSFTFTGTAAFANMAVEAWQNSTANPFDQQSVAVANTSSLATGSVTPSFDNELLVTGVGAAAAGGSAPSVDSGFTITDSTPGVVAVNYGVAGAYLTQTTASSSNPTWTTSATPTCVAIATFKGNAPSIKTITGSGTISRSGTIK